MTLGGVGIAIITYNRRRQLEVLVPRILDLTRRPVDLVIADDGGADSAVDWADGRGLPVIGGVNRGIAWNKNRAIYWLLKHSSADVIVLFEDDFFPDQSDWDDLWVPAVEEWGHVNALHPKTKSQLLAGEPAPEILSGSGTAADPYACTRICGGVIASTRWALTHVGFLDTRFKGYGHEHSEWTNRFKKSGIGVRRVKVGDVVHKATVMLGEGVSGNDGASVSDKSQISSNAQLTRIMKAEGLTYKTPWRTHQERVLLLSEVRQAELRSGFRRKPV